MKAIILAAGRGSRLGSITKDKPKCLTDFLGKTLLDWQIEALKGADINEIAIVRGYRKEKIQVHNTTYFDNERWNETNMVMSLLEANEWLENYECIVSYSDIFYKSETIKLLKNNEKEIAMTYNTNWLELWKVRFENPLDDAETFKIDKEYKLVEIGKKAKSLDEIQGQYMGLLKFKPTGWKKVKELLKDLSKEEKNKMDMTTLLNTLLENNIEIFSVPCSEIWLEVDSQEDLNLYKSWYEIKI